MYNFSRILKLLADPKVLKTVGDMSSIIDGYLELESEERCAIARDLSSHAEILIIKAKQTKTNKQEDLGNGTKH